MKLIIGKDIRIENPSYEILAYCGKKLVLDNPDYIIANKLGRYVGKMDKSLHLYINDGSSVIVPFGCLQDVWKIAKKSSMTYETHFNAFKGNLMQGGINLYDYQESALNSLIKGKNGVLEAPCGSGKTQIGLALIKAIGGKALWLTHTKKLLNQSKERAEQYYTGDFGTITEGKVNIGRDITFATVQTMRNLDANVYKDAFDIVVVDECFKAGTKITTPNGLVNIEDIKIGDYVLSYNHKTDKVEYKKVLNLFCKSTLSWYIIKLNNHTQLVCTGNHPIYTQDGYKQAKELTNNDKVLLCNLWERNNKHDCKAKKPIQTKGIHLLFKRMCQNRANSKLQKEFNTSKKNGIIYQYDQLKQEQRWNEEKTRRNENQQSIKESESKSQDFSHNESKENQTFCSRWQWKGINKTTRAFINHFKRNGCRCSTRIGNINAFKGARLSKLLQSRYSNTNYENSNRNRWGFSQYFSKAEARQKENCIIREIGVESVEIQKSICNGKCKNNSTYNFEVEDNNNYFANNVLVHNCHHAVGSPTKVMQFYKVISNINCRYKYGLSATLTRSDNLISCVYSLLGNKLHTITEEEVGNKIIKAEHIEMPININYNILDYSDADGTLNFMKLINLLSYNEERNEIIASKVKTYFLQNRKQLVLCHRVRQVETLVDMISKNESCKVIGITGKTKEKDREYDADVIVATYSLAKEGLDIPTLDCVHFATPQKDKAIVKQSAGRVERNIEGKKEPLVIDYVDENIPYCVNCFRKRKRILK